MEIRNDCATLPKGTLRHVRRSLSWVYPPDLDGIAFIRLIDKMPLDVILELKQYKLPNKLWHTLGFYSPATGGRPSYIAMHVPKILRGVPRWCLRTTMPQLLFARVLAHEVGHHLVSVRGYALHPSEKPRQRYGDYEEEMVDRYAFEVVRKMKAQWRYRFGHWLAREVAEWHFAEGRVDWERKNYAQATERFSKALNLNPECEHARQAYWLSKDQAARKLTGKCKIKPATDENSSSG
jgi:tetratricopeptide (TPR) repeat protein